MKKNFMSLSKYLFLTGGIALIPTLTANSLEVRVNSKIVTNGKTPELKTGENTLEVGVSTNSNIIAYTESEGVRKTLVPRTEEGKRVYGTTFTYNPEDKTFSWEQMLQLVRFDRKTKSFTDCEIKLSVNEYENLFVIVSEKTDFACTIVEKEGKRLILKGFDGEYSQFVENLFIKNQKELKVFPDISEYSVELFTIANTVGKLPLQESTGVIAGMLEKTDYVVTLTDERLLVLTQIAKITVDSRTGFPAPGSVVGIGTIRKADAETLLNLGWSNEKSGILVAHEVSVLEEAFA